MSDTEPSTEPGSEKLGTAQFAASGNGQQGVKARSADDAGEAAPLLPGEESHQLQSRWDGIQASFVDQPRKAVEEADNLVANAMKRMAEVFANERGKLEGQWDRGDDVSTEDLRLALRRYRTFFARLLAV
jgi:hypothetical protein